MNFCRRPSAFLTFIVNFKVPVPPGSTTSGSTPATVQPQVVDGFLTSSVASPVLVNVNAPLTDCTIEVVPKS